MPFITWSASFSVGVKELDAQHEHMIGILNRLNDAMRSGKGSQEVGPIINEMVTYAQFHFTAEEKILAANAYPAMTKQRAEHASFNRKAADFQTDFQKGKLALSIQVMDFLKKWWEGHIMSEDMKYAEYLNKKGVA
jgi:hemerythrin